MTNNEAKRKVRGYLTDMLPSDCSDEIDEIMKALEQQPCEDCISRAYIKPIIEELEYDQIDNDYVLSLLSDIKNAPSITPERPKGKWIRVVDKAGHWVWECDCKWQQRFATNFCPNCGSYNGGGEDD